MLEQVHRVAVALDGSESSNEALSWTLNTFRHLFKHVDESGATEAAPSVLHLVNVKGQGSAAAGQAGEGQPPTPPEGVCRQAAKVTRL